MLCWFSSLWAADSRRVGPVVGGLHVPQCRQRLQKFLHVGPAGAVDVLGHLLGGEGLVRLGGNNFESSLRPTLRRFDLAIPKIGEGTPIEIGMA